MAKKAKGKSAKASPPTTSKKENPKKRAAAKASPGKVGRPTKYKPEYCKAIIEFFSGDITKKEKITSITKSGVVEHYVEVPEKLPLFSAFARSIGVDEDTIVNWTKEYPEFFGAYTRAKALQKEFLIHNGIAGRYDTKFAMFVAVNVTNMKDKQDHTLGNPDGTPLGSILDRVCNHTKGIPSEREQ